MIGESQMSTPGIFLKINTYVLSNSLNSSMTELNNFVYPGSVLVKNVHNIPSQERTHYFLSMQFHVSSVKKPTELKQSEIGNTMIGSTLIPKNIDQP